MVNLQNFAGTPLISDPGARLVKAVVAQNFKVVPVPGPSAVLAALSASGLSAECFTFCGFLPAKSSARVAALKKSKGKAIWAYGYFDLFLDEDLHCKSAQVP